MFYGTIHNSEFYIQESINTFEIENKNLQYALNEFNNYNTIIYEEGFVENIIERIKKLFDSFVGVIKNFINGIRRGFTKATFEQSQKKSKENFNKTSSEPTGEPKTVDLSNMKLLIYSTEYHKIVEDVVKIAKKAYFLENKNIDYYYNMACIDKDYLQTVKNKYDKDYDYLKNSNLSDKSENSENKNLDKIDNQNLVMEISMEKFFTGDISNIDFHEANNIDSGKKVLSECNKCITLLEKMFNILNTLLNLTESYGHWASQIRKSTNAKDRFEDKDALQKALNVLRYLTTFSFRIVFITKVLCTLSKKMLHNNLTLSDYITKSMGYV